jgi:Carboxypeptidase regulatory-like domain
MNSRAVRIIAVGLFLALVWGRAAPVEVQVRHDSISGRVFNSASGAGVAGLSVRLIAPRALQLPVKITTTGANGEFRFSGLRTGKHLLTIYQGTTLLFRREIDNSIETKFVVSLKPVAAAGR